MSELVCMAIGVGIGMVVEAWARRRQLEHIVRAEWRNADRWRR